MWKQLLSEAHSQASQTKLRPKNLIVLGEEGCGKTELVSRIQGRKTSEDRPQGTGLEYTFLDVKDTESDDIVERMGVYILNGGVESANLLKLLVTNDLVEDTLVMLVIDFSRPWDAMDTLEKWSDKLGELVTNLDVDLLERLKKGRVDSFQSYTEPVAEAADSGDRDGEADQAERVVFDMEPDMLKVNLGIPIVVAATKSDYQVKLEQDFGYRQEKLDFIQMHLRKFCIRHGASLVYTGKGGKNKDLLYEAVVSAAYGRANKVKANPEDNQGVFIPSGWDNSEKIKQLTLSFQNISEDSQYNEQVEDASSSSANNKDRVETAEDEQQFLTKQKQLLGKDGPPEERPPPEQKPPVNINPPVRPHPEKQQQVEAPSTNKRPNRQPKPAPGPGKAGDKDVLTDFFNSLLNKDSKSAQ